MPFDEPVAEDQDLYRQAMRLGPPDMMMRPSNGQPMPQPPASVPDDALLRHAMSSGMKFSSPDAPQPGGVPMNPNPPSAVTDRSTIMPIAPPSPEQTLGKLIQQRAKAGQPIDASDPKYKMSTGMRVLGTAGNFLSGFGGSHRDPTYVGPGATNNQYQRDTAKQKANVGNIDTEIKNTENLNKENESLYRDAIRQSYESQIGQARTATSEAQKDSAAARQQSADVQKENADLKSREITYDPKTKRFMQNGKTYLPKTVEEGASLEAGNGIEGHYSKLWNAERKNQPPPSRQPTDLEMWHDAFVRDNKREPTAEEIAQRKAVGKNQATFKDAPSIDKYSDKWYADQRAAVRRDKAEALKNAGGSAKDAQDDYKQIEDSYKQRTQEFEGRKKDWYAQVKSGKPVSVNTETHEAVGGTPPAQPSPQATPAVQPAPAPAGKPQRKVGDVVPTKKGNMKITKILPDGKYEGIASQ